MRTPLEIRGIHWVANTIRRQAGGRKKGKKDSVQDSKKILSGPRREKKEGNQGLSKQEKDDQTSWKSQTAWRGEIHQN